MPTHQKVKKHKVNKQGSWYEHVLALESLSILFHLPAGVKLRSQQVSRHCGWNCAAEDPRTLPSQAVASGRLAGTSTQTSAVGLTLRFCVVSHVSWLELRWNKPRAWEKLFVNGDRTDRTNTWILSAVVSRRVLYQWHNCFSHWRLWRPSSFLHQTTRLLLFAHLHP